MIIPNIWENQKCSKPPTSVRFKGVFLLEGSAEWLKKEPFIQILDSAYVALNTGVSKQYDFSWICAKKQETNPYGFLK